MHLLIFVNNNTAVVFYANSVH